jgi:hypothetical protein
LRARCCEVTSARAQNITTRVSTRLSLSIGAA